MACRVESSGLVIAIGLGATLDMQLPRPEARPVGMQSGDDNVTCGKTLAKLRERLVELRSIIRSVRHGIGLTRYRWHFAIYFLPHRGSLV